MLSKIAKIDVMDDTMAEVMRAKTSAEKFAIANGMWKFARDMLRANIAQEHPDWSDEQVNHMVARRLSHGAV